MLCGVKFCGGCNPRFERGKALEELKKHFEGRISFEYAKEKSIYDILLIIAGCANCCASYCEYESRQGNIKLWDGSHLERIIDELEVLLRDNNGV